ncbi:DUF2786 domain-containing protein [Nocardia terpenica]|uniref:Uncharacterized protein n=1 Tax=Nocardia terpenica TaxID=455432 RepID=A0A164HVG2_9NOCA|nr:DUF2786 domain-containing protein [Nocardia terpenica]KZM68855.1 hypothetical protein AWN90_13785 [Nocardia terpenica]NQE88101.1 DUF2786 domain-containing protein [Nocardia terpenica]
MAINWEDKVRKLLALAEGPGVTEAEAELAREQAYSIIASRGLDEAKIRAAQGAQAQQAEIVVKRFDATGQYQLLQLRLMHRIASALHCESLHWTHDNHGMIVGAKPHVERVMLLLALLAPQMVKATKSARPEGYSYMTGGEVRSWRRSFAIGWLERVGRTLRDKEQTVATSTEAQTTGAALVLVDDRQRAELARKERFGKPKTSKYKAPGSGFRDGWTEGANADIGDGRLKGSRLALHS